MSSIETIKLNRNPEQGIARIAPHTDADTLRYVLVSRGIVEITVENVVYRLREGDGFLFFPHHLHSLELISEEAEIMAMTAAESQLD